ncbi:MAG: N-acetylmuramoyl-L-alanine amidase [Proteobacteria bacterium]|nr:N-acetylmuramoyl-L-alanine amidase [Pseudomonadota bacterium]
MIRAKETSLAADVVPSPCFEERRNGARPDILLLHYTGMKSCAGAIDWLSRLESRVSCHYVIDVDGRITQMVSESCRAWHAGVSSWGGESDVNSYSIGFEIHNPGYDLGYPDFPPAQMDAVIALSRDVIQRWSIRPERVLAHSDVAPGRKIDPGEKFDWALLHRSGVGHWVTPEPVDPVDGGPEPGSASALVGDVQAALESYGYGVPRTGMLDPVTMKVVAAFQRHFRTARIDGRPDRSTRETLRRLLEALPRAMA